MAKRPTMSDERRLSFAAIGHMLINGKWSEILPYMEEIDVVENSKLCEKVERGTGRFWRAGGYVLWSTSYEVCSES